MNGGRGRILHFSSESMNFVFDIIKFYPSEPSTVVLLY